MNGQDLDPIVNPAGARWPTGVMILLGLLIGAGGGLAADAIPIGMVTGLALGAGIDSVLNQVLNAPPSKRKHSAQ